MSAAKTAGDILGRNALTATTVLVTLKFAHVIDWPWWQVTAPWWGAIALIVVLIGVGGLLSAIPD